MTDEIKGPAIYRAISAVQAEMARSGIGKDRQNRQQGWNFRGIDDVYNALSSVMATHGLVVLPSYSDRTTSERQTKSGGALFYTVLRGEFTFVSTEDGTSQTVITFGEAMDTNDKSTSKAMSAALKYACMQTSMLPTEGDNDADATTHEVAAEPARSAPASGPSDKQRRMIWAKAQALFASNPRRGLEQVCDILHLPRSASEMSAAQASALIDELVKMEKDEEGKS